MSWPPPNTDEIRALNLPTNPHSDPDFEIEIDGEVVALKDQFQMYAPNIWLQIPLVSGILAPSLGGLSSLSFARTKSLLKVSRTMSTSGYLRWWRAPERRANLPRT
jgi:hypothetical protein